MTDLVGILREPEYSPGRVEDDAAVLACTRAALAGRGVRLAIGGLELLAHARPAGILAMCQSAPALAALDRWAGAVPVINTPDAIRACHRHETVRRLAGARVPFPPTRLVSTTGDRQDAAGASPCWVKRGDVHATTAADVRYAASPADVDAALDDFAARRIARAVLQRHVDGVVVKFYGVVDGRFFRCFTDAPEVPAPIPVLWEAARAGALALGLEVFGGDLVVGPDGRPVLVDVNDWPSFSRCREEAADAIAAYVVARLAANVDPRHEGQHG